MENPPVKSCPQCRQANPPDAPACTSCGRPFEAPAVPQQPPAPTGLPPAFQPPPPSFQPGPGMPPPPGAQPGPSWPQPGAMGPPGAPAPPADPGFTPPPAARMEPPPGAFGSGPAPGHPIPTAGAGWGPPQGAGWGPPPVPADPPRTNRVAVGIVAILLGAFGIHKFMLGMSTPGIILLIGSCVTCGLTSFVGLIEGIIYLMKSDAEFYQTYVIEKKQWF